MSEPVLVVMRQRGFSWVEDFQCAIVVACSKSALMLYSSSLMRGGAVR